jgi:hypothetical protein
MGRWGSCRIDACFAHDDPASFWAAGDGADDDAEDDADTVDHARISSHHPMTSPNRHFSDSSITCTHPTAGCGKRE